MKWHAAIIIACLATLVICGHSSQCSQSFPHVVDTVKLTIVAVMGHASHAALAARTKKKKTKTDASRD